jgi:hypothetical protein
MAKRESLVCEHNGHKWTREAGKRGRKPRFCDKHKPAVVPSNSTVTLNPNGMEVLSCAAGGHSWERPAKRGRKPVFCPTHKPATPESRTTEKGATVTKLHCELGNHAWERPAKRGRKPANCPEHLPVHVVQANSNGEAVRELWCEAGKHNWKRPAQRGRAPISCPEHKTAPVTVDKRGANEVELKEYPDGSAMTVVLDEEFFKSIAPGVPVTEDKPSKPVKTKAELDEEKRARGREIADTLDKHLRERGTHLSQNPDTRYGASVIASPYVLYRKVSENVARESYEWEMVEHHTPLQQAQFINTHAAEFEAGKYRYEKGGIVVTV